MLILESLGSMRRPSDNPTGDDRERAAARKLSADTQDQRTVQGKIVRVCDDALARLPPTRNRELPLPPGVKIPPRRPKSNFRAAHTFMNTGTTISGRPSMGSWVWYGLGAETNNLPGSSCSPRRENLAAATDRVAAMVSGILPSKYQGVRFYSKATPFTTSNILPASALRSSAMCSMP